MVHFYKQLSVVFFEGHSNWAISVALIWLIYSQNKQKTKTFLNLM